jgi:hypothetical protein
MDKQASNENVVGKYIHLKIARFSIVIIMEICISQSNRIKPVCFPLTALLYFEIERT